jgi:hypothetical protein
MRSAFTKVTRAATGTVISRGEKPVAEIVTVGGPAGGAVVTGAGGPAGGVGATGEDEQPEPASMAHAVTITDRTNTSAPSGAR